MAVNPNIANPSDRSTASLNARVAPAPEVVKADTKFNTEPAKSKSANTSQGSAGTMTASTGTMGDASLADVQLGRVTAEDSPMMRQARQEGMLSAAKRGLGNSSIAAGSAQAAATKAATPLALQNAKQNQAQELENQKAENVASSENLRADTSVTNVNTTEANKVALSNATEQNDMISEQVANKAAVNLQDAKEANAANRQGTANQQEIYTQDLAGKIAMDVQQISGEYSNLIATNQAAASLLTGYQDALSSIWSSDIPVSQKNGWAGGLYRDTNSMLGILDGLSSFTYVKPMRK